MRVGLGVGVGQRVGELSGFRLGGVEKRTGLGAQNSNLLRAVHKDFRYSKRNPRGLKWGGCGQGCLLYPHSVWLQGQLLRMHSSLMWGGKSTGADN